MRIFRAAYNKGVEKEYIHQTNPFRQVYTGIAKTKKRSISLEAMKKIKYVDLSLSPSLKFARDLFLFSFYTRGMSFIDIAFLRKKDIKNNILSYKRRKTNQLIYIKWEECMNEIVLSYSSETKNSPYLFPIINPASAQPERDQYRNKIIYINKQLKKLSYLTDSTIPLSTYVARHTWASIAKKMNIPLTIISECMGHDCEQTTRIYLDSLDRDKVDWANKIILNELQVKKHISQ